MQKNIFIASISIILASIFFVINDAIINYLSVNQIQFYHFVFYGSPAYLIVPLFLYFKGNFKEHLSSSNYYILLIRSLLFAPMPFLTFIALKNILNITEKSKSGPQMSLVEGVIPNQIISNVKYSGFIVKYDSN